MWERNQKNIIYLVKVVTGNSYFKTGLCFIKIESSLRSWFVFAITITMLNVTFKLERKHLYTHRRNRYEEKDGRRERDKKGEGEKNKSIIFLNFIMYLF